MDVYELEHLQDLKTQTGLKNEQLKNGLNFRKYGGKVAQIQRKI